MPPRPSTARAAIVGPRRPPVAKQPLPKLGVVSRDKRSTLRLDNVFAVEISSDIFGETPAIARNVSQSGIFVELPEPLPLGSEVRVRFSFNGSDAEIVAHGEVNRHYFLNFGDPRDKLPRALVGMGVRFSTFEEDGRELLGLGLTRLSLTRTMH